MWEKVQQQSRKEKPCQKAVMGIFPASERTDKSESSDIDSAPADGGFETTGSSAADEFAAGKSRITAGWAQILNPAWWAVLMLRIYRYAISPWLPLCCRFTPTCSQYSIEAFQRYGFFKGVRLTIWRLLRCQPFCRSGYDPVPHLNDRINQERIE